MNKFCVNELLENRNRNLGTMFNSEFSSDYLIVLFILLQFRKAHELEVLRDEIFYAILEITPVSVNGEPFEQAKLDQYLRQLTEWNIVNKRLEKTRLRSYKDVRRDRFQYSIPDETVAFLAWLEERHEHDLLPKEDDSINLLEFILSSLKQTARALNKLDDNFSAIIFAIGDVQEKTARLSRNLSRITVQLGEFLLQAYSPEQAQDIVNGLDLYFKHYLQQLFKLRSSILRELEKLNQDEAIQKLDLCVEKFISEQQKLPRLMRVTTQQDSAQQQLNKLLEYYKRGGRVDHLCGAVHDNAMKVLGKLTSYLKELERRSNRLEFINLRLLDFAQKDDEFEDTPFLRQLIGSAAAPLDMNYSDEFQKAEPPTPRSSNSTKKIPPKQFKRTMPFAEKHVETHEEMRLRILAEFLQKRYPQNGELSNVVIEDDEFAQISQLLKYGLLGNGKMLAEINKSLNIDNNKISTIAAKHGTLSGPLTQLKEITEK